MSLPLSHHPLWGDSCWLRLTLRAQRRQERALETELLCRISQAINSFSAEFIVSVVLMPQEPTRVMSTAWKKVSGWQSGLVLVSTGPMHRRPSFLVVFCNKALTQGIPLSKYRSVKWLAQWVPFMISIINGWIEPVPERTGVGLVKDEGVWEYYWEGQASVSIAGTLGSPEQTEEASGHRSRALQLVTQKLSSLSTYDLWSERKPWTTWEKGASLFSGTGESTTCSHDWC